MSRLKSNGPISPTAVATAVKMLPLVKQVVSRRARDLSPDERHDLSVDAALWAGQLHERDRGKWAPGTYIRRLVSHLLYKRNRQRQYRRRSEHAYARRRVGRPDLYAAFDAREAVAAAREHLRPDDPRNRDVRIALQLAGLNGPAVQEADIARSLGVSRQRVHQLAVNGRRKLRAAIRAVAPSLVERYS